MASVCVFGAGAIGGHLAARLAEAGHRVQVVARGAHLAAMRARGLSLRLPDREVHVHVEATADVNDVVASDVVLVTLKANAIGPAAPALATLAQRSRAIAFVTNGIPWWYGMGRVPPPSPATLACIDPTDLMRTIPEDRVVGAVAYSPNTVVEPGVVHCASTTSHFVIGPATTAGSGAARSVIDLLDRSAIGVRVVPDVRVEVWRKLGLNVPMSPVCTLAGGGGREVASDPVLQHLCRELLHEVIAVAAAQGFALSLDEAILDPARLSDHKPSMLQDLEAGRPLETDSILRAVQILARDTGVATPRLDLVTALVAMRARARQETREHP